MEPVARVLEIAHLNLGHVVLGVVIVLLSAQSSDRITLSSFGYPRHTGQITDPEKLLAYLQQYNRSIEDLYQGLWGLCVIFLWLLFTFLSCIAILRGAENK